MSVLVYIDQKNGQAKKASLEAATYAAKVAGQMGTSAVALFLGTADASSLEVIGSTGVAKVLHVNDDKFNSFDSGVFTKAIAEAADKEGADTVIVSLNQNGKTLGGRVAVRMNAGFVSGANSLMTADFKVNTNVFSGKAVSEVQYKSAKKVVGLSPNSIPTEDNGSTATVESFSPSDTNFRITVKETKVLDGEIPLTEAEKVVSAGRGLKGPENWGMIEELAKEMGAATACSRPVADLDWRPHHEHVGQTGVAIKPDLYIAIAISGAIQHLAGVNQSKVIVVINNDPEAPFFKAADYGIVGDAFEVVPKFVEAMKKFNAAR
jgi:electron transfer flavoprotein alpha subunit